jgi:hypothetical protein
MLEFEGKFYDTQKAIKDEWYPTRSQFMVRKYIVERGCKTRAEVAMAEAQNERAGRAKSIAAAKKSRFTSKS